MPEPHTAAHARLDIFVSVVTVIDAETEGVSTLIRSLQSFLADRYSNYEIVVVDDGAPAEVVGATRNLLHEVPCVRVIRLSRHFPFDTAVFSGLESAIGDYVVVLEAHRDPIEAVDLLVSTLIEGVDIVQGISDAPLGGSRAHRAGRSLFYWYNKRALGVEIPDRATYLTAFSRRAVNSLLSGDRQYRYVRHLMRHIGYSIVEVVYTPTPGFGRERGFFAGIRDGVEMITSYSSRPLRVASMAGLVIAGLNLLYAIYVLITWLSVDSVERGWTTTNLQLGVMFFCLFTFLAIISEYIGRLLAESRREPAYFVMEELVSDRLLADESRRNIV